MLDNIVKRISLALRKTFHHNFGGGWFYFIFSYFLFLVFTDFTVLCASDKSVS
ncbi:uncharacterized protein PGTG_21789 [Puccinia graminis f. sp. tritici CRL 75-36-700-3]|uniref:Uncharacterized protein n=1 Tax=Puccinia graminis f. sp. tritici (strain CRL 75-36-700-3 / race SCCL) TaxID=418459 RepID=H6QSH5_PUCGT|nr:uncharacterized protein PGTG_21789 [Puccinia graminis f. sp. tritici CRL 75-36-700-3]EHS63712.1 hypothetical protein PGTG_21789 [Puccinia graminis f. sp. tritici CRL 75-36-700-3]